MLSLIKSDDGCLSLICAEKQTKCKGANDMEKLVYKQKCYCKLA